MEDEYKKLFKHLKPVVVPQGLRFLVLAKIEKAQKRSAKIRLAWLGSLTIGSIASAPVALYYLIQGFVQSGFYQYLSLIASDSSILLNYWQELTMSLAESLPAIGTIAFLSTLIVFLWSFPKATKEAKIVFLTA